MCCAIFTYVLVLGLCESTKASSAPLDFQLTGLNRWPSQARSAELVATAAPAERVFEMIQRCLLTVLRLKPIVGNPTEMRSVCELSTRRLAVSAHLRFGAAA